MPARIITCRTLIDALDDYCAGELPETERDSIEGHLAGCDECGAYVESYVAAMKLTKGAFAETSDAESVLPDALIEKILRQRRRNSQS